MRAVTDVVKSFQMPGHGIEDFSRKSVQIAMAGIYDLRIHHDEVLVPVLRTWKVWDVEGLDGDGEQARDRSWPTCSMARPTRPRGSRRSATRSAPGWRRRRSSSSGRIDPVRIFGFPLRVSPLLPVVLLALGQGGGSAAGLVAFVVGGVLAILVHELGHAFAARAAGASEIEISLVALGGVTTYVSPPSSRRSRIGIAVAGPLTGIAIGVPLLAVRAAGEFSHDTARVLESLVFVTLGWAVLDLLPVRPFDGGHVLESVLPGGEQTRVRLASAISVVFALAVAAFAYERSTWTAGMFLLVAAMNLFSLLPQRRSGPGQSAEQRSYAVLRDVLSDVAQARETARGGRVDASVEALLAGLSDPGAAARLEGLAAERPDALRRTSLLAWAVIGAGLAAGGLGGGRAGRCPSTWSSGPWARRGRRASPPSAPRWARRRCPGRRTRSWPTSPPAAGAPRGAGARLRRVVYATPAGLATPSQVDRSPTSPRCAGAGVGGVRRRPRPLASPRSLERGTRYAG